MSGLARQGDGDVYYQRILRSNFDEIVVTTTEGSPSNKMHIPREEGGVFCGKGAHYGNPKDPSVYPESHASPCRGCLAAHPDVPEVDTAGFVGPVGQMLADIRAAVGRMERVDWEQVPAMSGAEAAALTARLDEAATSVQEAGRDD